MNHGPSKIVPNLIATSPSPPPPSSLQNVGIKRLLQVFASPILALILIVLELCIVYGALSEWFIFAIPLLYVASIYGNQKYTLYVLRCLVAWHILVLPLLQLLTLGPIAVTNGPALYLFWFIPNMFVTETQLSTRLYRIYDWIRVFLGSFTMWFMVLFFKHISSDFFQAGTLITLLSCTIGLGISGQMSERPDSPNFCTSFVDTWAQFWQCRF